MHSALLTVSFLLLVNVVVTAPPGQRVDGESVVESPPNKDVAVERPIHLDGVPLERDGDINKDFRQEVILGSDDASRDPEQLTILIKNMFYETDENKDGVLSSSELERRIVNNTQAHLADSQQEAAKSMRSVDTDGDGMISWGEYLPTYLSQKSKHNHDPENLKVEEASHVEDEHNSFKNSDDDGNGVLDDREWLGFLHPEHSKDSLMEMAADIIKSYDKNGDGIVSRDEFTVALPGEVDDQYRGMEEAEQKKRVVEFDRDLDSNKDGKATLDEFYNYVNPKNPQHARREVEEIMSLADGDGDGQLSLAELLERDWLLETSALINANRRLHDDL